MPKARYKKRKDGRYSTSVHLGYNSETGAPIVKTAYGKSCEEVDFNKKKIKDDYIKMYSDKLPLHTKMLSIHSQNSTFSHTEDFNEMLFGKYKWIWYDAHSMECEQLTNKMYKGVLNNHTDELDNIPLNKITRSLIQQHIKLKSNSPRTCQKIKTTLNQMFNMAVDDGYMLDNPVKNIKLPKYKSKKMRILTDEEYLLTEIADFTDREKAFVMLMKFYGLRDQEALAIGKKNFDFNKKTLTIYEAVIHVNNIAVFKDVKSENGVRVLPLIDHTIDFFKDYINKLPDQYFFKNLSNNRIITACGFRRMWLSIKKKIKNKAIELDYDTKSIDSFIAYMFRHNYATNLAKLEIPIAEATYLMGHSSYAVTSRYYTHYNIQMTTVSQKMNKQINEYKNEIEKLR